MQTPDEVFGDLFVAVQISGIFPDSKTFPDCEPLRPVKDIVEDYLSDRGGPEFSLKQFVKKNFQTPSLPETEVKPVDNVKDHINNLWQGLSRSANSPVKGSSLLPLTHPYIVPGGRFGEIYYWDSYFTMLGLEVSGRADIIRNMVANFSSMIQSHGRIPNGNRTYFLSRSQPPFFCLMVDLLAQAEKNDKVYVEFLPSMLKEYHFWMKTDGTRALEIEESRSPLNRYWDDKPAAREESYIEDMELLDNSQRDAGELFTDIRAACESGWDFSCRWFEDPSDMRTIRTTEILPIDLNSLMYINERIIAHALHLDSNERTDGFISRGANRKAAINKLFWDDVDNTFKDFIWTEGRCSNAVTMASAFPLFAGIATEQQAKQVAEHLEAHLLKPGGWSTTNENSGQQWDAPNGWAPLQWIAFFGLRRYGFESLANEAASRWVENCIRVFKNTGRLVEKYNVEDITLMAGGGEYDVQDGFGWTNGVLLKLMDELDMT